MNPLATAKRDYATSGKDFEQELAWHLQYGCVFATPDRFIMGHAIHTDHPQVWPVAAPNAWYVTYATGRGCLTWFINQAPYPLPFIAWRRNKGDAINNLKVYATEQLTNKLSWAAQT